MIRRTHMRRAYNAGRWERARFFAFQIIPSRLKQSILENLSNYLEPMTKPYALELVNHYSE